METLEIYQYLDPIPDLPNQNLQMVFKPNKGLKKFLAFFPPNEWLKIRTTILADNFIDLQQSETQISQSQKITQKGSKERINYLGEL